MTENRQLLDLSPFLDSSYFKDISRYVNYVHLIVKVFEYETSYLRFFGKIYRLQVSGVVCDVIPISGFFSILTFSTLPRNGIMGNRLIMLATCTLVICGTIMQSHSYSLPIV